ncbi:MULTISPECIES: BTAD domain-containing putative transcriptional regulator [unclassified Nocardioides]|uniref:nSTAND1 domain-containing NTPase n=1 Tax=unclassified Nocardioides TaxID=2615069 RepID=UPI00361D4672
MSADQLSDALWGERPPASAGKILQGCVVRIRKVLGWDAVRTSPHGYALHLSIEDLDSLRFEDQVARARELLTLGEADRAAYLLTDALDLWHGEAFADLESWEPAIAAGTRLSELRLEAEELRVDALLRAGRYREVLSEAQVLVRAAPLREHRWVLLARAQYQSGQQGEALRTIHQLKGVLAQHLGIDPGPDVVALETSILRQDSSLLVADAPASSATCPWLGLRPYGVEDADWFFGREDDLAACLEILARTPVLALVGPSGSGKSSLLRAGVAAALRRRGQSIVTISPGVRPMESLTALTHAPHGAALLVDQCEELFSLCEDAEEQQEFLRALTAEAANRTVVIALRADHLADLAAHPGFSRLVERGMYLVGALDEEGLRTSVETPARQAGLLIEPGLVDLLVREVRNDPGALPLMSHALQETWKRREGSTLTVAGYRASGGINGAVAQSAEGLYARVEVERRDLLRDLVLRLVSPGPEGEPVRTRVPRRLVGTDPEHEQLIEMLVAARLVTSDDGALEITHEALTRAWPRLRGWLDDDVEGQRIRHHLSAAADAWAALGRPDSELYRGVRLARAVDWRAGKDTALTEVERQFLEASARHDEAKQQSIVERARAQARMIRRLRIALGAAAALLALALVAGVLAAVQSDRANDNAARAEQGAVAADARQVGARGLLTDDPSLSMLLAAAGARLDDSPETRANLVGAVARHPELVRSTPAAGGYVEDIDVDRDGRWIAVSDDENRVHLHDAATNRLLRSYDPVRPDAPGWMLIDFRPGGDQLAVILNGGGSREPVRLLDADTMEPATTLDIPGGKRVWGVDVRFSPDGRYLAAAVHTVDWAAPEQVWAWEDPGYTLVWDLRSPSAPAVRVPTGPVPQGIALSPHGRTLYTGWPLTAYDVATGERLWRRSDLVSQPGVDVNAEGGLVALADSRVGLTGTNLLLVDAATGATVRTLRGHRDMVRDVQFSLDGSLVGSHSHGGDLIVWDTASGRPLERWETSALWGASISPGGDHVYEGGGETMLRTWDRSMQDTYLQQTTRADDAEAFAHVDVSLDGQQVAYSWVDGDSGWVRFVDTATGAATTPTRISAALVPAASWHPDGGRYLRWSATGDVTVLDTTTGDVVDDGKPLDDIVAAAYVDGGRRLLVGDSEERSHLVDAESLRPVGDDLDVPADFVTPIGDGSTAMAGISSPDGISMVWRVIEVATGGVRSEGTVPMVNYGASVSSPDGSTVAMVGESGEIVNVDASTGALRRRSIGLGAQVLGLDYSVDGELLVSSAVDGRVSLWDATTLDQLGTVYTPRHGAEDPVSADAQFVGDSHDVAIASYDGTVYRWETDLDRALDFACRMAGRDLTEEEWEQFLPDQPFRSVCPDE